MRCFGGGGEKKLLPTQGNRTIISSALDPWRWTTRPSSPPHLIYTDQSFQPQMRFKQTLTKQSTASGLSTLPDGTLCWLALTLTPARSRSWAVGHQPARTIAQHPAGLPWRWQALSLGRGSQGCPNNNRHCCPCPPSVGQPLGKQYKTIECAVTVLPGVTVKSPFAARFKLCAFFALHSQDARACGCLCVHVCVHTLMCVWVRMRMHARVCMCSE